MWARAARFSEETRGCDARRGEALALTPRYESSVRIASASLRRRPRPTVNISVLFNVVLRKSFTHCVARSPVIRLRRQIDDIFRNTSARPDEDATGYTSHICAAFSGSTVHQACLSPSGDRNVMLVSVEEDHIVEGPQLQRSLSIFTGHVLQVSRNYPLRAVRNKLVE